jgi:Mg2+-importing ATPase
VLLVNLLFERPLLLSFLFALALAVGLTPELLPMVRRRRRCSRRSPP